MNQLILSAQWKKYLAVVIAVASFWLVGDYVNYPVRFFLKEKFPSVPYWADHILFMTLAKTIFSIIVGYIFFKREEALVCLPKQRKYIFEGILSGLLGVTFVGFCLKLDGLLNFQFEPEPLVMFGNLFSNFYEEFIYRGVLLGLLYKLLDKKLAPAMILSSIVFVQGHLHYPVFLVSAVFISGLYWCSLAIRSKSLLPVWISHCLLDFIADTVFAV